MLGKVCRLQFALGGVQRECVALQSAVWGGALRNQGAGTVGIHPCLFGNTLHPSNDKSGPRHGRLGSTKPLFRFLPGSRVEQRRPVWAEPTR